MKLWMLEIWQSGHIQSVSVEMGDAQITFMHPCIPSCSFHWPEKDICWVPGNNILCHIKPPTTSSGHQYFMDPTDAGLILNAVNQSQWCYSYMVCVITGVVILIIIVSCSPTSRKEILQEGTSLTTISAFELGNTSN